MNFNVAYIKENWKKYDWLVYIVFVLCLLIPMWVSDYLKISKSAKYSIGTTVDSYIAKGFRKQTDFEFFAYNKKIKGSYTEVARWAKNITVPNGKYLIVYAENDPSVNLFLFDKPILDTIDLDSLNSIGVHEDDIRFWGL